MCDSIQRLQHAEHYKTISNKTCQDNICPPIFILSLIKTLIMTAIANTIPRQDYAAYTATDYDVWNKLPARSTRYRKSPAGNTWIVLKTSTRSSAPRLRLNSGP